jgi:Zn-dependent M28 family amino/carboxypeptidase
MRPGGDRLVALAGLLAARDLPYSIVKIGGARHAIVRVGEGRPRLALVAHYDRVGGGPGALDNSCACIQLADFAARLRSAGRGAASEPSPRASVLVAFTDAEEAPGSGEASTQGSFALARSLRAAAPPGEAMAALVLDVTGRGGRLLLSKAPAELLERNGLSTSEAASGNRALLALARKAAAAAGIAPPIEAALPWSDDLGLTLGGLPALALSLLPEEEAAILAAGGRPPLWDILHTEADAPELAEDSAFALVASFLDALALELVSRPDTY